MAALVQTIPQQSGTVSVLQSRPSSSGSFTPASQQQNTRTQAMSWNNYNSVGSSGSYRAGHQVVAPYALTSTPTIPNPTNAQNRQSWSPHLKPEHRTSSAPSVPQGYVGVNSRPLNTPAAGSVSSSATPSFQSHMSKDDTAISTRQLRSEPPLRPLSTVNLPSPSSSFMNISSPTVSKPSPDRYRRGNRRPDGAAGAQSIATAPNLPGSSTAPALTVDDSAVQPSTAATQNFVQNAPRSRGHIRVSSADDTSRTERPQPELAKRYRRRSWGNIDNAGLINLQLHLPTSPTPTPGAQDYFDPNSRPKSANSQKEASASVHSAHSSTSSAREQSQVDSALSTNKDELKRPTKSSPLSQPASNPPTSTPAPAQTPPKENAPSIAPTESLATRRLAEVARSDSKKPGKSRLRRAFSFGSASELLKASNQNAASKREAEALEEARKEMLKEQLGPEQAAIAEQQEASGLGESIYSHHQGHLFNRSTDNLSVSSTASSASIMLRKMGKGMKRSTRSLVGLFRPKSVNSISSTDGGLVEPMAPQISVVNVEADTKSVTVNPDPLDLPRGGTVFPKVEGNDTDASKGGNAEANSAQSRKSIVGGDRERAEVLAAVRKGILKKTYSDIGVASPATKVADSSRTANGSESPHSSAPSTPEDQARSARRGDAVKIAGEDYFMSDGRLANSESKSAPISPQAPKSLVFSPRTQFHDTWTSSEYDRRGEIATCNRLTPLLASQIKEELNNFKMEMEVHETSKVYTHFL